MNFKYVNIAMALGLLFLILFFSIERCNRPKPLPEKKVEVLPQSNQPLIDSLKSENYFLQKRMDSAKAVLAIVNKKLTNSERKLVKVSIDLTLARKSSDTGKYVVNCDSLQHLAESYVSYAKSQQDAYEQLLQFYDSTLQNTAELANEKERQYQSLKAQMLIELENSNGLIKKVNILQKQKQRKFVVGVGAGYGLGINWQLQPSVGIYITRQLFRFKL